jgi:hypothetical protein
VIKMRAWPMLKAFWTLFSLVSAFFVLGFVLGDAAWNGVNFVLGLYLVLSVGGFLGLFAGFCSAFSRKRVFAWIACVSSLTIACLSAILALGFIFGRTPGVPLSNPISYGPVQVPLLLLYGVALVCCSIEAALYYPSAQKL